ncbi:SDR family NAD(P)-dependent oxidoreductase [Streptomyces sp. NPDC052676]|uniref:SDR family NAD(P)-dependent oxidoreductase n=1 Tax=Streptomyces sp. NPDC052676 TaxID=3154953 RepID=UPI00341D7992
MRRSVLVTGASGEVGTSTALRLAAAGFDVTATVRGPEKAERLRAAADERRVRLRTEELDVTDEAACAEVLESVIARCDGRLWGLVSNAGGLTAGAVEDVTEEHARRLWEVNVMAPARLARLVLPVMRGQGQGRIVNVSSLAGRTTFPGLAWYCATKAALSSLTEVLRMETSSSGVRVILVEPGPHGSVLVDRAAADLRALVAGTESVHRETYAMTLRVMDGARALPDAGRIAAVIHRALRSPRPRPAYLVGAKARMAVTAELLLATRVADHVKQIASCARSSHPLVQTVARRWFVPW